MTRYRSLQPLIRWRALPRPVDWRAQFGREAPLEAEIGFGNGEFLVRRAQAHPERDLVGIELEWGSVSRALRRIDQLGLGNVRLVQLDARIALERLFAPRSLSHAYALFPCPWPKRRHEKHRLFSREFLRLLNSRLQPDGDARIVTDSQPFAAWVQGEVAQTGLELEPALAPCGADTKYERKWRARGQQAFHELRLRKREHVELPLGKEAKVQTHRVARFDPERFHPASVRGDVAVEFKDFLFDAGHRRGMARVVVAEGGFTQDFWIELVAGPRGWHIRPARGCQVVPTAGVQRALDLTRDAAGG